MTEPSGIDDANPARSTEILMQSDRIIRYAVAAFGANYAANSRRSRAAPYTGAFRTILVTIWE
jgi:hypothetical protein